MRGARLFDVFCNGVNQPDQKSSFTPSWIIPGALALPTYPKSA
jgi:hypothetical protein